MNLERKLAMFERSAAPARAGGRAGSEARRGHLRARHKTVCMHRYNTVQPANGAVRIVFNEAILFASAGGDSGPWTCFPVSRRRAAPCS